MRGEEAFEIDHFRPRRFKELVAKYENLYYSCRRCNQYKGAVWPSAQQSADGYRFADPCAEDMYATHLRQRSDGELDVLTNCGRFTHDQIRLYRKALVEWRKAKLAASRDVVVLTGVLENLRTAAEQETNPSKRGQALEEISKLQRRIEDDREQFLS